MLWLFGWRSHRWWGDDVLLFCGRHWSQLSFFLSSIATHKHTRLSSRSPLSVSHATLKVHFLWKHPKPTLEGNLERQTPDQASYLGSKLKCVNNCSAFHPSWVHRTRQSSTGGRSLSPRVSFRDVESVVLCRQTRQRASGRKKHLRDIDGILTTRVVSFQTPWESEAHWTVRYRNDLYRLEITCSVGPGEARPSTCTDAGGICGGADANNTMQIGKRQETRIVGIASTRIKWCIQSWQCKTSGKWKSVFIQQSPLKMN